MTSPRDRAPASLPLFDALDVSASGDSSPVAPAATAKATAAGEPALPDHAAREEAADPRNNVVLEASAGTGKTSVLVRRYLALLAAGVDPANILAITFTRKAAAEMRERILSELKRQSHVSDEAHRQWRRLRDRVGDIAICTIDAFCLALLAEFPLEADLDPSFGIADETEIAVLLESTIERALRVAHARASVSEELRLLLAQVPQGPLARGLTQLLDRRVVAAEALNRVLARAPATLSLDRAVVDAAERIGGAVSSAPGGFAAFGEDRPREAPGFDLLMADLACVLRGTDDAPALRASFNTIREYFLARDGKPRTRPYGVRKDDFPSEQAWKRHKAALANAAPAVAEALARLDRDTNLVLVKALRALHTLSADVYRRGLDSRDIVDFAEALSRTVSLLANMDEFSQSRYRLQSRYHHVLVDEFQDTSRLQWRLVSLLVEAWGEGQGLVHEAAVPPTIFVVGDRKQSIYRFRDADVTLLGEAARFIGGLRPGDRPRRAISTSFRARPPLLAFVNDLCDEIAQPASGQSATRDDAFRFDADDRFPLEVAQRPRSGAAADESPALGVIVTESDDEGAEIAAQEIGRLLESADVRDRDIGVVRRAKPGDIAVLFRARDSYRALERALEARAIPSYVYKGLGFFDSDEIQDLSALIRFLARPSSKVRAAAFLRSRFVRLSDPALLALAGDLPRAISGPTPPGSLASLSGEDRDVLTVLREAVSSWLGRVDRVPPAELLDDIVRESAYASEIAGLRAPQARENVKKLRALVRRLQNRGYLTMARLAEHLERLSAGDESNAIIDAADAVNLMTVHAAKGLEFPIVFVVSLARGTSSGTGAIRVMPDDGTGEAAVAVGGFRSDADERALEADREESKRLLYVAITRARDRLYLAATLRGPHARMPHGSLGEVLPRSFLGFLGEVSGMAGDVTLVAWRPPGGATHELIRLTRAESVQSSGTADSSSPRPQVETIPPALDADPAPGHVVRTVDAREWALEQHGVSDARPRGPGDSHVLIGRLAHRLFQLGLPADASLEVIEAAARALVRAEEASTESTALAGAAARAYSALRQQSEVADLLARGDARYEVPFTLRVDTAASNGLPEAGTNTAAMVVLVRGTVDCLVLHESSRATVLEFKTGGRATWHESQLATYVEAMRRVLPSRSVEGRLVYPVTSAGAGAADPGMS